MIMATLKSFFNRDASGIYSPLPFHDRNLSVEKDLPSPIESSAYSVSSTWRPDPRTISDATLGLSDGLTVPFALTAGLAALGDTRIVVFAGLAELMAGSISMGIGGYLGASGEAQSEANTKAQTIELVHSSPAEARAAVVSTLGNYISAPLLDAVADDIAGNADNTIAFLLQHQHHMEAAPASPRLYMSGLIIALGYFFGGLVPLLPYIFLADGNVALVCSIVVMVFTLFGFGFGKTALLGEQSWKTRTSEGIKMIALGGTAAIISALCVRLVHE